MFKRKRKQRQVKSVFSDQIILENSLASSECEIYLPEPKLKFGKVKGLSTLIRESGTILFGKSCVLHLCHVPIPYSPAEITLLLKDTEQENKVFLHMILNRHEHDLFYKIQEPHWHECQRKVNDCWRTIVIKFNKTNSEELVEFNKQLETVITELEADKSVPETYLLVAVPLKDQPPSNIDGILTKSSEHKETVTQPDILSNLDNQNRSSTVSSESSKTVDNEDLNDPSPLETTVTHNSSPAKSPPSCKGSSVPAPQPCSGLYDPVYDPSANLDEPPFDPAPFVPWTPAGEDINKTVSVTDTEDQSVEKTKIGPTEISDLCDSLHIHPKELPRRLASILNSIGSVGGQDNQGLDSEHLISEEIYMQMGVEKKMSAPSPQSAPSARLQEAMKIARSLQTAINEGDQQIAVMNAVKLAADNNVTVKIEVKEKEEKDPLFRLKVCIEDKDSSGGHISLMVRASDTIGDLKQRMSFKHQFPEEIQSWIIGKRIPPDTETLGQCMIKGADHTTYLYLRSAKSVGLTFEAYQKRRLEQFYPAAGDASPVIGENPVAGGTPMACNKLDGTYMAMHAVQKTPAVAAVGSQPAFREPGSATPPFKQTPAVVKQEAKVLAENLNTPTQKGPKPKQVVQGRVRDPSHIAEDHPLNLTGPDINAMLKQFSDFTVQNQEKSNPRVPVMHPEDEPTIGWVCSACTYINKPTRPGCEVCTQTRPLDYKVPDNYILSREEQDWLDQEAQLERQTKEAEDSRLANEHLQSQQNYMRLQQTDARDLVPNVEAFTCSICFDDVDVGQGVVLRNCLHHFCKSCLSDHIGYSEEPVLQCPFVDDNYSCDEVIQDREVRALVSQQTYDKYLARSLQTAESQAQNSFHCKTADCPGWCIYEDYVNFFVCPVCRKENCLTCKAIHQGMNCKQYQDDLRTRAANDKAANQTQTMIKKMVDDGDAMPCPQCQVIVMKKEGCDWIQCSICKTEICWVTKGPRWGPLGSGDTSGGCRCRVDGQPCHPNCNNCH